MCETFGIVILVILAIVVGVCLGVYISKQMEERDKLNKFNINLAKSRLEFAERQMFKENRDDVAGDKKNHDQKMRDVVNYINYRLNLEQLLK